MSIGNELRRRNRLTQSQEKRLRSSAMTDQSQNQTLQDLLNKVADLNKRALSREGRIQNLSGDISRISQLENRLKSFKAEDKQGDSEVMEVLDIHLGSILRLTKENKKILKELESLKKAMGHKEKHSTRKIGMRKRRGRTRRA